MGDSDAHATMAAGTTCARGARSFIIAQFVSQSSLGEQADFLKKFLGHFDGAEIRQVNCG